MARAVSGWGLAGGSVLMEPSMALAVSGDRCRWRRGEGQMRRRLSAVGPRRGRGVWWFGFSRRGKERDSDSSSVHQIQFQLAARLAACLEPLVQWPSWHAAAPHHSILRFLPRSARSNAAPVRAPRAQRPPRGPADPRRRRRPGLPARSPHCFAPLGAAHWPARVPPPRRLRPIGQPSSRLQVLNFYCLYFRSPCNSWYIWGEEALKLR
jgi:hypothetical protein